MQDKFCSICLTASSRAVVTAMSRIGKLPLYYDLIKLLLVIDSTLTHDLKFKEICTTYILSPDEFQFWWNMLRSRRTRFNITAFDLEFRFLSECLTVLSLCSDCPQLEYVDLEYSEADTENEDEVIKQAKGEFIQKFGFIQKLNIHKD